MKIRTYFVLALITSLIAFISCCTYRVDAKKKKSSIEVTSAQAIIYTTRNDYSKLVPIILTPDKKGIASYPDIKDVYYKGSLAYPTSLHKGYLLDNRGISVNVAFIKLTYEQYAALQLTPAADELMKKVVDKNPVDKMFACGQRSNFANVIDDLNALIDNDNFSGFKRLK